MAVFKCKMCGGALEVTAGQTTAECEYCGTKQTLPRLDDDRRANLYDRANHFRRSNDFDKAAGIYEQILSEDNSDAEAYWSLVLCRYGIEYVEDPGSRKRVPTVNRAQFTSIFDDENYKSAIANADAYQKTIYEAEAKTINEIQKGILAISQNEEPFDVFISYKETDNNGRRTQDSVLATELYHQLTNEGFRVFLSRITLEDKLGVAYEPYIFAALNSAKVMVALGTKPENFNAVWVKNEWSRYLALVKQSGGKKVLIPAFRDMDPYDLPEEFSHLQAQDMSKLGFMQDLVRGIKKIMAVDAPKAATKETVVVQQASAETAPLLKRVFMYLEDGDFKSADDYCERVLDLDPENARAYLGKLMAELKCRREGELKNQSEPFDGRANYAKTVRFGDEALKKKLEADNEFIRQRNLQAAYDRATSMMNSAKSEDAYKKAAEAFRKISGFKDANNKVKECLNKAEDARKDAVYASAEAAKSAKTEASYKKAAGIFDTIHGWRDADKRAEECRELAENARKDAVYASAEKEMVSKTEEAYKKAAGIFDTISGWRDADKRAEECRELAEAVRKDLIYEDAEKKQSKDTIESLNAAADTYSEIKGWRDADARAMACLRRIEEKQKAAKKHKKNMLITAIAAALCVAAFIVTTTVIIPNKNYSKAVALYEAKEYDAAIEAFEAMDGYKDSAELIELCETGIKDRAYDEAVALYNSENYDAAMKAFKSLNGHKDSKEQIKLCETAINDIAYNNAVTLYEAKECVAALAAFEALNGYKDSNAHIAKLEVELIKSSKVGDVVSYGSYEQDNNTSNGKEAIKWQVLDKQGNKLLLISKYALDCKQYNTEKKDVTWETCTLRTWLNNDFIKKAFSDAERGMIETTKVTADNNPKYNTSSGNDTEDKVFLLSIAEAEKYFSSDSSRQATPTKYAVAQRAYTSLSYTTASGEAACWWWLRSPGYVQDYAATVTDEGSVGYRGGGVSHGDIAVRPAMWVNLD